MLSKTCIMGVCFDLSARELSARDLSARVLTRIGDNLLHVWHFSVLFLFKAAVPHHNNSTKPSNPDGDYLSTSIAFSIYVQQWSYMFRQNVP